MKSKVLVFMLAFLLESFAFAGTDMCSSLFLGPHASLKDALHIRYDVILPDLPVNRQCSGTCHLESSISLLEGIAHQPISSEYSLMRLLQSRVQTFFENKSSSAQLNNLGYVDFLNAGASVKSTLHLLEKQGILNRNQFTFSPEFRDHISSNRDLIEGLVKKSDGSRLSDLEIFNIEVGLYTAMAAQEIQAGRPPVQNGIPIKQKIDDLFKLAFSGVHGDPNASFKSDFPNGIKLIYWSPGGGGSNTALRRTLFKIGDTIASGRNMSSLQFSTSPHSLAEIEPEIRKSLDRGNAVQLGFVKNELLISADGILREDPKDGVSPNDPRSGPHGATITGYKLDESGQIEWLLIRDSQGSSSYDHGYIHMHVDYFRRHVLGLVVPLLP